MRERETSLRSLGIAAAAAILVGATSAAAQTVEGRTVEAGSDEPVAGASVLLIGAAGKRVDFALTDAEGRFRLAAPGAGSYRIVFERIGFEGSETGVFSLAAGEVSRRRIEVPVRPLALPPIEAVTERRCRVRPAEGEAASRIWDEVRKALEAAEWTERKGHPRFTLAAWERRLHPRSLEVIEERTRRIDGTSRSGPWVTEDPELLVREGFVRREGEELVYGGPDAATILSDAFLDTHCFRVVSPPEGHPGWIGLAFAPDGPRDVPDVRGVLWVDRESSELERLDFDYVDLPRELRFDVAGGQVEFRRMDSGEWIVDRWWIRMPIVGVPRRTVATGMRTDAAARSRPRLLEVEEDGGEVVNVRLAPRPRVDPGADPVRVVWSEPIEFDLREKPAVVDVPADPAAVARTRRPPVEPDERVVGHPPGILIEMVDARSGEPVDRVQVSLPGSGAGGTTDVGGRLALGPLRPGRQTIELVRLGYVPFETVVEVPADDWKHYRIELHPMPVLVDPIEATVEADKIDRAIGEARYRLTAEEIPDHTPLSVPELVAYRFPGLHYVRTTGGEQGMSGRQFSVGAQVCPTFVTRNGPVQLYIIDGVRYTDACMLQMLHPGEIDEIAVITSYAGQTEFGRPGGGVVIIRTKRLEEGIRR